LLRWTTPTIPGFEGYLERGGARPYRKTEDNPPEYEGFSYREWGDDDTGTPGTCYRDSRDDRRETRGALPGFEGQKAT